MSTRHDPWEDLDGRAHVELAVVRLPDRLDGGLWWPLDDGQSVIFLDERLDAGQALKQLTHELVHDERGGIGPSGLDHDSEEAWVRSETTRRLEGYGLPASAELRWGRARTECRLAASQG